MTTNLESPSTDILDGTGTDESLAQRNRPTKALMVVVGGSIVIAGFALTYLGIQGRLDHSFAKNDDEHIEKAVSTLSLPPMASPVSFTSTSMFANSIPGTLTSNSITVGRPSLRATSAPSMNWPPTVIVPTKFPSTMEDPLTDFDITTYARANFPPKMTGTSTRTTNSDAFHLRLYWEEGYLWQESPIETFWCMACASCNANIFREHCDFEAVCKENMMLAIMNCPPNRRIPKGKKDEGPGREPPKIATFTVLKNESRGLFGRSFGGDRIQVLNTNLCLQRMGERDVLLKQCDDSVNEQLFYGLRSENPVMELIPFPGKFIINGVETERCLAQHHHPRQGERIYAESCVRARNADHHWWVKY